MASGEGRIEEIKEQADHGSEYVWLLEQEVRCLLKIVDAARDVLVDFDYVNEWGYEEGGKSLGDNLERLRDLLEQEPQDD